MVIVVVVVVLTEPTFEIVLLPPCEFLPRSTRYGFEDLNDATVRGGHFFGGAWKWWCDKWLCGGSVDGDFGNGRE